MNDSKFIGASIGWSRGAGFIPSGIIRRLEKSYFNHVYYRFDLCNGMSFIYESHLTGGVQITPYPHLRRAVRIGKVEDVHEVDLELNPWQMNKLWDSCEYLHGDGYDTWQIIRYYLAIRLHRKKLIRKKDDGRYTCNELIVEAGKNIVPKLYHTDFGFTPEPLFELFHGGIGSNAIFGEKH